MRFKHLPDPVLNEVREKTWFAFIPLCLENETRWLEKVTVRFVGRERNYPNRHIVMIPESWVNK